MKIYQYSLGIDDITERVDDVVIIGDIVFIDENEDYLTTLCNVSEIDTDNVYSKWGRNTLFYTMQQEHECVRSEFSRYLKSKLHELRKTQCEITAQITMTENDIERMGEYAITKDIS